MKKLKILFSFAIVTALIFSMAVTNTTANSQHDGWGIASWYCSEATGSHYSKYLEEVEKSVFNECCRDFGLSTMESWSESQLDEYLSRLDAAVEEASRNYQETSISFDIAVSFTMPEDPGYLENYVKKCKPYVYVTKDGNTYSKTDLVITSNDSDRAIAVFSVKGAGNYEFMICHNGVDGVPVAQSSNYSKFSTMTLSVYNGGISSKCTYKMSQEAADNVIKDYQNRENKNNQASSVGFTDVTSDKWFSEAVNTAAEMGLIKGKTDTTFAPDDNITYAEAITLACRMNARYKDIDIDSYQENSTPWYSSYLNYAKNNNIPYKFDDYNAKVSRSDFVHIFYSALPEEKYEQINEIRDGSIPDVSSKAKYSSEIYTFYRAGIITGSDSKCSFLPDSNIKRSEVATIMCRMFDIGRQEFSL